MKRRLLAACMFVLLLSSGPSRAAEPAASAKPRTLAQLVELAMKEGKDEPLRGEMAAELGLGEADIPKKKLRYKQSITPDKKEHTFAVLYAKAKDGKETPSGLLVTVGTGKREGDGIVVDGRSYYATLQGKLLQARHNFGRSGSLTVEKLKLDAQTKRAFKVETDFHEKAVPSLGLEPTQ